MVHRVVEEILVSSEWRDGEFAKLKINSHGVDESLWCRMCIPIVYAHWEGYVDSSLKLLIDHLNRLDLKVSDVKTEMIVVCLDDKYQSLSGKQSFDQRVIFTDKFKDLLQETVRLKRKIDMKSNLNSKVLAELCKMYCFDFGKFSEVIGDIDILVRIRNSIAHGENSFLPKPEDVNHYITSVRNAMDVLRDEIEKFLLDEAYLTKG